MPVSRGRLIAEQKRAQIGELVSHINDVRWTFDASISFGGRFVALAPNKSAHTSPLGTVIYIVP